VRRTFYPLGRRFIPPPKRRRPSSPKVLFADDLSARGGARRARTSQCEVPLQRLDERVTEIPEKWAHQRKLSPALDLYRAVKPVDRGNQMPFPRLVLLQWSIATMFRLLVASALAYVTYRITRKMVEDVPDTVDPLLVPPSRYDREALRRQSVAMGIDPQR
jgi:hypothetical protein